jgi:TonB family protein
VPRENGVEGTVYVGFIVETDGSITNPTVKRGPHADLNTEAARVVAMMPKWVPGRNKEGKAVRVAFTLPIKFKLDQNDLKKAAAPQPTKDAVNADVLSLVPYQPEFNGGLHAMMKWIGENMKYPAKARENGVEGTVFVSFIVEKDGSLSNIDIKRDVPIIARDTIKLYSVDGGVSGNKVVTTEVGKLGDEAKRVVAMMPKWKAGRNSEGQPVRVAFTLPIKFKLE